MATCPAGTADQTSETPCLSRSSEGHEVTARHPHRSEPVMNLMLKKRIQDDMKAAMKAADKRRLGVIRLILAAIKQREVDERVELDDAQVLAVLDKMVKQRRDSLDQYTRAGRDDLADQERYEVGICQEYLPAALGDDEIAGLVEEAVTSTGASSMKDMGRVMGVLKPKLQGRADIGAVSKLVKQRLGA
jgi:uncharacterized protein YqeY